MAAETTIVKSIFRVLTGALRHRWLLRLILLLVLLASAFLILRGHFGNDLSEMLPDGSRSAEVYRRISNSPMFNKVVVQLNLNDGTFGNSPLSGQMDRIVKKLEQTPFVTRVDALFYPPSITGSVNALTVSIPQLFDSTVFSLFLSENAVREKIREIIRRLYLPTGVGMTDFIRGDPFQLNHAFYRKLNDFRSIMGLALHPGYHYFVSGDEKHVMILLETDVPVSDAVRSRKLLDSLHEVFRDLPSSVSYQLISGHQHAVANESILKKDVGVVGLTSVLLFTLLFILFYRCDYRSLMIPVLPVLASVIILGVMTLIFGECLFFVVGMGGVVISLAVDYGIHVYAAYRCRTPHRRLARLVPAVFAGALTSALAFGLFLFSRINACRQLGFFAGTSLLLSFFLMLLILPAFLNRKRRCDTVFPSFRFPLKYPMACTAGWILLCIGALISFAWIGFQMDIRRFDATPKEILQNEADYERQFQVGKRPAMLLVSEPSLEAVLEKSAVVVRDLRAVSHPHTFFSPGDFTPPETVKQANLESWREFLQNGSLDRLERQMRRIGMENGMKKEFFDPFFENLRKGIQHPLEKAPELFRPIQERLISKDKDGMYTCALLFLDTPENLALVERLFPELPVVSQSGFPALISREVSAGILQLAVMTAVMVILITFLFFRSIFKTFLAMIPVCSAILFTGAFFALAEIPVSLSTLIAGIILVGLSIDYGIFMVHSGFPEDDPVTFHAVTLSAATSAAGGATVIFTTHPMLRDAGFTLIVGISVAWATSVILLPALWQLNLRNRMRKHHFLFLLPLLLVFLASCRGEPFEHPAYEPLPPVSEASVWMERFRGAEPAVYLAESGVVLEHFFQSFAVLSIVRVDEASGRITVMGLSPAGARLFEVSGVSGAPDSAWWLPDQPWSPHEKEASKHVMEAVTDIYMGNLPPKDAVFRRENGKWMAAAKDAAGRETEYWFAGNPPRLIQKKIYRSGSPSRTISYYRYLAENGRMRPADILLEQGIFSYRLVIRTRAVSESGK